MSWDRLYNPSPCSDWPITQLRAVGDAYREAAGRGDDQMACLARAEAAYIAAGGAEASARRAVVDMIASLSREHGDWLWGPAQERMDRQRPEAPTSLDPTGDVG
jgi:hypothetical protein